MPAADAAATATFIRVKQFKYYISPIFVHFFMQLVKHNKKKKKSIFLYLNFIEKIDVQCELKSNEKCTKKLGIFFIKNTKTYP